MALDIRFDQDKIAEIIGEFRRSGMTQKQFCEAKNISSGTFIGWLSPKNTERLFGKRSDFIKVSYENKKSASLKDSVIDEKSKKIHSKILIRTPKGFELETLEGTSVKWISKLIMALQ
jgi:hypothetical protein